MKKPETLKEKIENGINMLSALKLKDVSNVLQLILNKGHILYGDFLGDTELSILVKKHIKENISIMNDLNIHNNTSIIEMLSRQNIYLIDYITLDETGLDRAVARCARSVP